MGTKTGRPTNREKALNVADVMVKVLNLVKLPGFIGAETAGSIRRGKETVSDADIVVWADIEDLTVWNEPWKTATTTGLGIRWTPKGAAGDFADVRVEFYKAPSTDTVGATMLFTTGPASLNVYMRQQAIKNGWKLSQYGLLEQDGRRVDTGDGENWEEDEGRMFDALEMPRLTPQQRENWRQHVAAASRM